MKTQDRIACGHIGLRIAARGERDGDPSDPNIALEMGIEFAGFGLG
jgi:hypothetical protein